MILDDKLIVTKDHADASSTGYASIKVEGTTYMDSEYDILVQVVGTTISASDVVAVVTADSADLSTTNPVTIASYTAGAGDNVDGKIVLALRKSGTFRLKKYLGIKTTTATADEFRMVLVEKMRVNELSDINVK